MSNTNPAKKKTMVNPGVREGSTGPASYMTPAVLHVIYNVVNWDIYEWGTCTGAIKWFMWFVNVEIM